MEIKRRLKALLSLLIFLVAFLFSFVYSVITKEKYVMAAESFTVTIRHEPQQSNNGIPFREIAVYDTTAGRYLMSYQTTAEVDVTVPYGHYIEVRFKLNAGHQFYGITRSDGWCGGTFVQGTGNASEARNSIEWGYTGGNTYRASEGLRFYTDSPGEYYYYYMGVYGNNTIFLLTYDNIQLFGMDQTQWLMDRKYVNGRYEGFINGVYQNNYVNMYYGRFDKNYWYPLYYGNGDIAGDPILWGTYKDIDTWFRGFSSKAVRVSGRETYGNIHTDKVTSNRIVIRDSNADNTTYSQYNSGTKDAYLDIKCAGIFDIDLINISPRGATTTAQIRTSIYDNRVFIRRYYPKDNHPGNATFDANMDMYLIETVEYATGGKGANYTVADYKINSEGYILDEARSNKSTYVCRDSWRADNNVIKLVYKPVTYNVRLHKTKESRASSDVVIKNDSEYLLSLKGKTGVEWSWKDDGYFEGVVSLNSQWRTPRIEEVYNLEGWTGLGWKLGDDIYIDIANMNLTNDLGSVVDLYSVWKEKNYSIELDSNGGYGTDKQYNIRYEDSVIIDEEISRPGYNLSGWNSKRDGSGEEYKTGSVVNKLKLDDNGKVVLYAMWEPKKTICLKIASNTYDKSLINDNSKKLVPAWFSEQKHMNFKTIDNINNLKCKQIWTVERDDVKKIT